MEEPIKKWAKLATTTPLLYIPPIRLPFTIQFNIPNPNNKAPHNCNIKLMSSSFPRRCKVSCGRKLNKIPTITKKMAETVISVFVFNIVSICLMFRNFPSAWYP